MYAVSTSMTSRACNNQELNMTQDLSLAIVHHWALLMLVGALCAEFMLLRLPPSAAWLRSLARADLVYGASAGLMLLAGLGRVVWGAKGAALYLQNPVFWTKLGLFLLIGLLSVWPTVQFIRWRKQHAGQGSLP